MKQIDQIPFSEIPSVAKIVKDFISGELADSQQFKFCEENFAKIIQQKSESYPKHHRETLKQVLLEQNKALSLSDLQQNNLKILGDKNCFTVTTGHQLNLFTGPVFFIYKILQIIKTANWLRKQFPENQFVPLFWMASEDHDFDEINHFQTKQNFYQFNAESGKAVGKIIVEDLSFAEEFRRDFQDRIFGEELIRRMQQAYVSGRTLADATRHLVNGLFSEYGLLILDGDATALKALAKPVFRQELLKNAVQKSTEKRVEILREKYGKVQVNPREINLFYLGENRERIDAFGDDFILSESGRKFSREEILIALENHPEKFSPNALLRPVYQETILPNIAYIGGNAEVAYWLEMPDFFAEIGLPFPVLIPRNSLLFLTEKTLRKIKKTDLQLEDFFGDFNQKVFDDLLKNQPLSVEIENQKRKVEDAFQLLMEKSEFTDVSFRNLVVAEQKRQLKSFERMKKRLLRAEKIKEGEKVEMLERLYQEVHPGKIWQERSWNFSEFFADEGRAFFDAAYSATDVESPKLSIMQI